MVFHLPECRCATCFCGIKPNSMHQTVLVHTLLLSSDRITHSHNMRSLFAGRCSIQAKTADDILNNFISTVALAYCIVYLNWYRLILPYTNQYFSATFFFNPIHLTSEEIAFCVYFWLNAGGSDCIRAISNENRYLNRIIPSPSPRTPFRPKKSTKKC